MSVDGFEYDLLMKGIANAFRTPEIIALIGQQNGVAVTLFQWSSEVNEQYMIPWNLLKDPASILSFAAKVEKAERDPNRGFTAIGGAIDFGVRLIAENAFEGRQLKIDVSGDGRNNIGVPPSIPRQKANALEIVINGLPILTYTDVDSYDLDIYYREKIIRGPGAFVEIANDYDDIARAFVRKLRREFTPLVSQENTAPRALIQTTHSRQPNVCCGSRSRSADDPAPMYAVGRGADMIGRQEGVQRVGSERFQNDAPPASGALGPAYVSPWRAYPSRLCGSLRPRRRAATIVRRICAVPPPMVNMRASRTMRSSGRARE